MRGAEGAAFNVCLFWLPLIEVSSLMTPHKTDYPYGVDCLGFVEAIRNYLRAEERQSWLIF